MIDECHTAITANSWRPKLARLRDIRLLPCQHVFLTATLPPSLASQLQAALLIPTATILRARTTQRPGTQYAVVHCRPGKLVDQAVQEARSLIRIEQTTVTTAAAAAATAEVGRIKGIVYCRSRQLCEQIAAALGCSCYHAGVASRTEILQAWRQTGGLIVCTSALGVGVDIPSVRFTLHVDQPWSLIDFVQESGRAREQGKSVILVAKQPERPQRPQRQRRLLRQQLRSGASQEQREGEEERENSEGDEETEEEEGVDYLADRQAVEALVRTSGCRRAIISRYLDGVAYTCQQLGVEAAPEAVLACDNCAPTRSWKPATKPQTSSKPARVATIARQPEASSTSTELVGSRTAIGRVEQSGQAT